MKITQPIVIGRCEYADGTINHLFIQRCPVCGVQRRIKEFDLDGMKSCVCKTCNTVFYRQQQDNFLWTDDVVCSFEIQNYYVDPHSGLQDIVLLNGVKFSTDHEDEVVEGVEYPAFNNMITKQILAMCSCDVNLTPQTFRSLRHDIDWSREIAAKMLNVDVSVIEDADTNVAPKHLQDMLKLHVLSVRGKELNQECPLEQALEYLRTPAPDKFLFRYDQTMNRWNWTNHLEHDTEEWRH